MSERQRRVIKGEKTAGFVAESRAESRVVHAALPETEGKSGEAETEARGGVQATQLLSSAGKAYLPHLLLSSSPFPPFPFYSPSPPSLHPGATLARPLLST
jgi:hypothetical protein